MAKPPVIGFVGVARSGKDTAADFYISFHGGYKYSFADPIRAMLRPLGVDMNDPFWIERKEQVIPALGVSPRRLMQTLGTEWGRDLINKDLWLLMAQARLLGNGPGMVIADVRYEEEAAWVRKHDGLVVHLKRALAAPVIAHSSELIAEVQDGDLVIENDGTLEQLHAAIGGLYGS